MTRQTAVVLLALGLSAPALHAQEKPTPDAASDPNAVALLDAALAQIESAERLSVELSQVQSFTGPEINKQVFGGTTVRLDGGNVFAIRPMGNQGQPELVSDGETLWTHLPQNGRFTQEPAPATLMETPLLGLVTENQPALLALFDPAGTRAGLGHAEVTLRGEETWGDRTMKRVGVAIPREVIEERIGLEIPAAVSLELWIDAEVPHRIRRMVPDVQAVLEEVGEVPEGLRVTQTLDFLDWQTPEAFPEGAFTFEPPAGGQLVGDLFPGPPFPAKELVGKPAPDFRLAALDGPDVALADLKGQIVVLDFWATWCPACVVDLPKVKAAVDALAGQGVVLYAVNAEEPAAVIRAFLDGQGLAGLDVLHGDLPMWEAYRVETLPQTVVIDREGVVRHAYPGWEGPEPGQAADLDALSRDLEALLAEDTPVD